MPPIPSSGSAPAAGGNTAAPNRLLINPALARALSVYCPDEIQAAVPHLEAKRAAAQPEFALRDNRRDDPRLLRDSRPRVQRKDAGIRWRSGEQTIPLHRRLDSLGRSLASVVYPRTLAVP
jgi:hypothetical protein